MRLGREVGWADVAEALVNAFAATLNLELVPGVLLPNERALIERLLSDKYTNSAWTENRKLRTPL